MLMTTCSLVECRVWDLGLIMVCIFCVVGFISGYILGRAHGR